MPISFRIYPLLLSIIINFFAIEVGAFQSNDADLDSNETAKKIVYQAQKFKYLLEVINSNYVDTLDIDKIVEPAFDALLKNLDPQSVYFNAEKMKIEDEKKLGIKHGPGIDVIKIADTLYVTRVEKKSPAEMSELKPGDMIYFIDGKSTFGLPQQECEKLLKGDDSTFVNIIFKRGYSNNLKELSLMRRDFEYSSVTASYFLGKSKIAYIDIERFSKNSYDEFINAIQSLDVSNSEGLIIDVRGNTGGYLDVVTKIISEFFPQDTLIAYTKARNPIYKMILRSNFDGNLQKVPVVILINSGSASASEILAGAIQDHDRGLVVGEISYGKGSAQNLWRMNDGSGFRITIADYFIPSGRNIQKDKFKKVNIDLGWDADSTLKNNIEKQVENFGGKTQLPVHYTDAGRIVFGGGGIFPDNFATSDTLNKLFVALKNRGIFLYHAINYIKNNGEFLRNHYLDDFKKFYREFKVSEKNLYAFTELAKANNIWNDSMFNESKIYIENFICAMTAFMVWGDEAYSYALHSYDKQISTAMELMEEASKMVRD